MLIHEPLGLGHPYRIEPFERTPHYPLAGETSNFRVSADSETNFVYLVIEIAGTKQTYVLDKVGQAVASENSKYGQTAKEFVSESHLADAAARSGEYSHLNEWSIQLETFATEDPIIYWFESDAECTSPFSFQVHNWLSPAKSRIAVAGKLPEGVTISNEEWLTDPAGIARKVRFALPLRKSEKVIGFGERFHAVVQNGELVDSIVYEEYKGQGHRTYLPTPFAHVVGGHYGFHLNTSAPSFFDVGQLSPELLAIEVKVEANHDTIEVDFFHGTPSEVLSQYLERVGTPLVPPPWIYELWISSNEWNTQERINLEVAECVSSGIHPGVVVLEAWSDESTFTVFRDAVYQVTDGKTGLSAADISYPEDGAWPNPQLMIDGLHDQGIKLLLWQIPVIKDAGEVGSQAETNWNFAVTQNRVLLDGKGEPYKVRGFWFQNGLLPDLTDPGVREWWGEQRRYLVEDLGVDGFKTDGGEHAWGADLRYLDGETGLIKNNLFPVSYARTFHELLARYGKTPVTFSRAGYSGSQQFPTFWAGDENSTWKAFRASISAGITASASGFYFWGWDIGGFSGDIPTAELYLRGAAMAAFCPIMQVHSEYNHHQTPSNDRTPWNLAKRHNDPDLLKTFRRFSDIRKLLVPYLTAEGEHAVATGRPLMAGLFFDYSDDDNIWEVPYQYQLGRDLLVAPVVEEGCKNLRVYLPQGEWVDLITGESLNGGLFIEKIVPLNEIAVFVRLGAWGTFHEITQIWKE